MVDRRHRLARLKRVILTLSPQCQLVLLLSRIDGLSHVEIAQRLGISVAAVEKHIVAALAACRAEVGDIEH